MGACISAPDDVPARPASLDTQQLPVKPHLRVTFGVQAREAAEAGGGPGAAPAGQHRGPAQHDVVLLNSATGASRQ